MYEIQKEAKTLETLRKRAQVSYGIYAVGAAGGSHNGFCK